MKVIVIGGGIVGVSAARALAEADAEVIVLERASIAGEASGLNAGIVGGGGWGHVPDLETTLRMGSRAQYLDLAERGHEFGLDRTGTLTLVRTAEEWAWAAESVKDQQADGHEVELVGPDELGRLEPSADPALRGAILDPLAIRAEPVAATRAMAAEALAAGAAIRRETPVRGLRSTAASGWEVTVGGASAPLGADVILLAAGPWCADLGRPLGIEIPIVAVRGQMWASAPQPPVLRHAISAAESPLAWSEAEVPGDEPLDLTHRRGERFTRHLYGRQRPNGEFVFGGDRVLTADPVADRAVDDDGTAVNHGHVAELLPVVKGLPASRTWSGLMPFSLDGRPLLGPIPEWPGLFLAGGLASSGFGRGPMAGLLAARQILNTEPGVDLSPAALDGRVTTTGP